jgi:predicted DNA binding CopG/RHH family protein
VRKREDTLKEMVEKGAEVLGRLEPKGRKAVRTSRRQAVKTERRQEGGEMTTKVTVRMPVELVKALKHMAIDEGRTFQDLITEAVREFLRRRD